MDNNATILVCFAIKEEAKSFQRIVKGNPAVRVLITGMGKRNAENAVRAVLDQQTPAMVLTCGFAGGLDPALALGAVIFEDSNTQLADKLEALGAKRVRFFCASRMFITPAEKHALREKTGAHAVEMESGHIRALCCERNIPCTTVRVISDTVDEELPLDFSALMTPEDRISYARLGLAIVKSPGKVPHLLAVRKQTTTAAEKLTNVLKKLLQSE